MKRVAAALFVTVVALAGSVPAFAAEFELNIGSLAPEGTPWRDLLDTFEKNVETGSGGRINVIIRPPGQMGEVEMVREVRRGERLQACAVTTAAIAEGGNAPEMQIVELPYLFENNDEADYILDEVVWQPVDELLGRRGFVLGVWSENGWRHMATRKKPIRAPADLAEFKMRAQESDVHMAMWTAFGAQAVQKPMTEVLTALQSNVVDGLDNTALYIKTGGLADALDHFTLTGHIYQPAAIVFSKRWFDTLPADLQTVVRKQKDLAQAGREAIRAEDAAIIELLREDLEVIELTPAERAKFVTVGRGMHESFAATVAGTELLHTITSALDARRKK